MRSAPIEVPMVKGKGLRCVAAYPERRPRRARSVRGWSCLNTARLAERMVAWTFVELSEGKPIRFARVMTTGATPDAEDDVLANLVHGRCRGSW